MAESNRDQQIEESQRLTSFSVGVNLLLQDRRVISPMSGLGEGFFVQDHSFKGRI
jgi:hypothetical protein